MNPEYDFLIAFKDTPVNTVAREVFQFKLFCDKWIVKEHAFIPGVHNPFTATKSPNTHLGHQQLIIKFKPILATQKCICYYVIEYPGGKNIILRVTGKGESLNIQMSLKHIDFYRLDKMRKTKTTFQLINNSNIAITFQFDIDNDQKLFRFLPLYGTVKPHKYELITATFETKKEGIFMLDVPCLFLFNEPINVQLFGINSSTIGIDTFEKYKASCLAPKMEFCNAHYFHSCIQSAIYSMTQKYFSFNTAINKISSIVEVLNRTDECLKISWDTENEKNFVINPAIINLRPRESRLFECKFVPVCKEVLMGAHIYGRAQLYDLESTSKMELIYIKLRVIGNSFEKGQILNPNLLIPHVVQLPICYVGNTVYTAFVVTRTGPYPTTFCFIPPVKTYFNVKPKVGIVKDDFQIFMVQFRPEESYDCIYKEDWTIELNGKPEYTVNIIFECFVPEAKLIAGDNFVVNFGIINPGLTKSLLLPVSNINAVPIKIKFFERNNWFSAPEEEKIIDCFESTNIILNYKADRDVPQKSKLRFYVYVMPEMGIIEGNPLIFSLTIFASCAFSELSSIPNYYNFKNVVCGTQHKTKFRIYNFGVGKISFALKCYKHFGSAQEDPFLIIPNQASLESGDNLEVTVTLCSYESCLGTYCIRYHLLLRENSNEISEDGSALIFKMDYYMYYPILQIVEVGLNRTGSFYGKKHIWDFFHINELNHILKTIKVNETRQISVRTPDAQGGQDISREIVFIMKNISETDTTCHFKRKKICDCRLEQMEGSFTFRKYSYNCPHKNILKVSAIDNVIKAFKTTFINVQINFNMSNTQHMCYLMQLSHNRTIVINFEIKSLQLGELSTYAAGLKIQLKNVSIGEITPSVQIYKVSNNTSKNSMYRLSVEPIKELNRKAGYPILMCLNPVAQVNAKSCEGLMFVFAPISLSKIKVDVPIQLGGAERILQIEGEGTVKCTPPLQITEIYSPCKEYYNYPFLLAHISVDEITIRCLPTFSKATRIFTLRNVSKDKTLAFWFQSTHYEGIIKCAVNPSTGLLLPGCCICLVLTVTSFSIPCTCQAFCSVHLIDQTALCKHFQTHMQFNQEANESNDLFTILDNKTIHYPKPKIQVEPPPRLTHRNITIACNIIASSEIETKVPLRERFKMQPCQELCLHESCFEKSKYNETQENIKKIYCDPVTMQYANGYYKLFEEFDCISAKCCSPSPDCQFSSVSIVTESVISDVLESMKWQYKLSSYLAAETELYYQNFCKQSRFPEMDERMMNLALNRIPDNMLSEIMQVLIGNALMHHFHLGTYPELALDSDLAEETYQSKKELYSNKFAFLLDNIM